MKIRTQLLLLLFGALFTTTLIVSGVQFVTVFQETRQNMELRARSQAGELAQKVNLWVETIWQVGEFMARLPAVYSGSNIERQRLLGTFYNVIEGFDNLVILNAEGQVTHLYPLKVTAIGTSYEDQPYFRAAVMEKRPQITGLTINPVTGKPVMVIAQPAIDSQGVVRGALLLNVKMEFLQNLVASVPVEFAGETVLFAADGQVLARQGVSGDRTPGVNGAVLDAFRRDWREVVEYQTGERNLFGAVNRVFTPGWGVVVSLDEREVWKVFQVTLRNGVIVFGVIFALISLAAFTVFRRLFRSVTEVTEKIERMSQGDWAKSRIDEQMLQSAPQELQRLCITFNHMADVIRMHVELMEEINEGLEKKVEERTQEILSANEKLKALNQQLMAMNEEFVRANMALETEVTERLRIQNELADTNEELSRSLDEVTRMQEQLLQREKMAALGNLVAGIAHEINTPVGVSVTAVSLLEEEGKRLRRLMEGGSLRRSDLEDFSHTLQESVEIVMRNLAKASDLVRSFKKIAVDQMTEECRSFNLKNYLEDVLVSLRPVMKKTNHEVRLRCEETLVMESYPGIMSQIVTNLIMNALAHAYDEGDRGIMVLRAEKARSEEGTNWVEIEFSDDGRGMSSTVAKQIFEPFFTTKRGRGGTGLGLYIVYNLVVEKLGGTISCQSTEGKGTSFLLRVPLTTPAKVEWEESSGE